ncbi:hypothetical protein BDV59DRAFT_3638 [Aspergillus ambiguus]|uniref:uncharacterized protein n=1 Tax=Aspergillus ambiguus TaxID=176160 RepID=UPI003CCCC3B0
MVVSTDRPCSIQKTYHVMKLSISNSQATTSYRTSPSPYRNTHIRENGRVPDIQVCATQPALSYFLPDNRQIRAERLTTYVNDRLADPVFALSIGLSAAFLRIRREEREKYPERSAEIGMGEIVQTGGRRLQRWWAGDFEGL